MVMLHLGCTTSNRKDNREHDAWFYNTQNMYANALAKSQVRCVDVSQERYVASSGQPFSIVDITVDMFTCLRGVGSFGFRGCQGKEGVKKCVETKRESLLLERKGTRKTVRLRSSPMAFTECNCS